MKKPEKLPESGTPNTDADVVERAAKRAAEYMEKMAYENPLCQVEAKMAATAMYALATELAYYRNQQSKGITGAINRWIKFFKGESQ